MRFVITLFLLLGLFSVFDNSVFAADCSVEADQAKKAYTLKRVNLRSCPSTYCDALVTLPAGQTVFAYREEKGWSTVNVRSLNLTGYIYAKLLSHACVEGPEIKRADLGTTQVKAILIARSRSRYSRSCPCPYNVDRGGRRCGGRSAYSRPGGQSPLCYPSDVSSEMISRFKADRKR